MFTGDPRMTEILTLDAEKLVEALDSGEEEQSSKTNPTFPTTIGAVLTETVILKTVLLKTVLLKAVAVSVTKMVLQISTDSFFKDSFVEDSFVEGSCSFSDQDGVTDKYRQVMGLLSKAVTTNLPTLLHICSVLQGSIVLVA